VRQLFLIVLLVSASFLGGAFVNGPGLQWLQRKLLQSLKLNNNGEITSIELKTGASAESDSNARISELTARDRVQVPLTEISSVEAGSDVTRDEAPDKRAESNRRQSSATDGAETPVREGLPPLALAHSESLGTRNVSVSSRSDVTVKPAVSKVPQTQFPRSPSSSPLGESAPALLDSLAALLPMQTSTSSPSSSVLLSKSTTPTVQASAGESWMLVERKLQSLGVARYTVEGTPGGSVVFSCLIPLAGSQAITQRFEGEGDDIIHASKAAMRRITLWRTGEPGSP
jgi:hypothetical protein